MTLFTHALEMVHERFVNAIVDEVMALWEERQDHREVAAMN